MRQRWKVKGQRGGVGTLLTEKPAGMKAVCLPVWICVNLNSRSDLKTTLCLYFVFVLLLYVMGNVVFVSLCLHFLFFLKRLWKRVLSLNRCVSAALSCGMASLTICESLYTVPLEALRPTIKRCLLNVPVYLFIYFSLPPFTRAIVLSSPTWWQKMTSVSERN